MRSQFTRRPVSIQRTYVSIRHFYHHNYTATRYSRSPSLRLNGNWLEEAGFSTDTPVIVSVEPGRLVIEPLKG
ncbi:SymE family type I addiction module toxin [Lelliottia sp. RWM.1]|uniref:SymE family type I addiction module toxin n=1 Tax=Lelliottia sp. RWM.1 TaxID=2663242 RepID=UPI0035C86704